MPENNDRPAPTGRTLEVLLDLRSIIAALFAVYGGVLTVMGAAGETRAELNKAGGWNVNLWCGVAMLALAAAFAGWVLLRPVRPPAPSAVEASPSTLAPTA